MKKSVIDKLGFILLNIIIVLFSIIVGANEKGLRTLPISILLLLMIIYFIIKKIKSNESIFFKNKIDIYVFVFVITIMIPLIFRTYSSLAYEMEFIIKYIFYYSTYLLARNTIHSKKDINIIFNTIIFSSLLPIIIGFDGKGAKHLKTITDFFNVTYPNKIYKPSFNFGYANTVAVYVSMCIFLCLYYIYNSKKRIVKILYVSIILFFTYVVYYTYSRFVVVLLILSFIIFIILKYKKNIKLKTKKIFHILSVLLLLLIAYLIVGLNVSKPLEINNDSFGYSFKYNFKDNNEYIIKLDYNYRKISDNYRNSEIIILSDNEFYKKKILLKDFIPFGNNVKEYYIKIPSNSSRILLTINNEKENKLTINKIYINDKEEIINYKYLPRNISEALTSKLFRSKSLVERKYMYQVCLNIFKLHPLFGSGGNAWTVLSKAYETHAMSMKESHSYFFELLISFGIVGVIAFFIMLKKILSVALKNKNDEHIKVIIYALSILLIHAITFDFDLSFMFIQILMYTLFAIIASKDDSKVNIKGLFDYIVLVIIALFFVLTSLELLYTNDIIILKKYYPLTGIINKRIESIRKEEYDNIRKLDELKKIIDKDPFYKQNELYNLYVNTLKQNNNENIDDYYEFIINELQTIPCFAPYYISNLDSRLNIFRDLYNSKYKDRVKEVFINEYEKNIEIINNKEANGSNENTINRILSNYEKFYNEVMYGRFN